MKNILFVFLFVFIANNAHAGMPISDFIKKVEKVIENVQEGFVTPLQENVTQLKAVVNEGANLVKEGKSKIEKAKAIYEKAKGVYEKTKDVVKDPVGTATSTVASLSSLVNDVGDMADGLQKEYVVSEYPTFKEKKRKVEKVNETQNKRAADTYAMAMAHRAKLIEEGKQQEEDFDAEDQDTVLKAINAKVSEIVVRLNYVQMFEAMTDELTYFQSLATFDKSEDEDE